MVETYYGVLGLSPGATADEIVRAYRRRVREWHPDVNHSPDAPHRIRGIYEAYEVLRYPESRAAYDERLSAAASASGAVSYGRGGAARGSEKYGSATGDVSAEQRSAAARSATETFRRDSSYGQRAAERAAQMKSWGLDEVLIAAVELAGAALKAGLTAGAVGALAWMDRAIDRRIEADRRRDEEVWATRLRAVGTTPSEARVLRMAWSNGDVPYSELVDAAEFRRVGAAALREGLLEVGLEGEFVLTRSGRRVLGMAYPGLRDQIDPVERPFSYWLIGLLCAAALLVFMALYR